jgi:AmmeMemoRadiSam system protein A
VTRSTPKHVREELLVLARKSIELGLKHGARQPCPAVSTPELLEYRSTFVTLRNGGELRGCCGSVEPMRPLAQDAWHNAWASAFCDPRFPPIAVGEWPAVDVHLSILSTPEPLPVSSEDDLLMKIRPGIDGLILELGHARATFLPSVWEQVSEPEMFLRHLKLKAGWSADFWSPQIKVSRYITESFGADEEHALS